MDAYDWPINPKPGYVTWQAPVNDEAANLAHEAAKLICEGGKGIHSVWGQETHDPMNGTVWVRAAINVIAPDGKVSQVAITVDKAKGFPDDAVQQLVQVGLSDPPSSEEK